MGTILLLIIYIVLSYLTADFITGLGHWLEDRYGRDTDTIIGKYIVHPNVEHHKRPRDIVSKSYWSRNGILIVPLGILAAISFLLNLWFFGFTFLWLTQANEFHCATHRPASKNKLIKLLRKLRILQRTKEHALHHVRPYDKNYCVITSIVNSVLTYFHFFETLEAIIGRTFRIYPLAERKIY